MIALTLTQCAERRGHERVSQGDGATYAMVIGPISSVSQINVDQFKQSCPYGLSIEYASEPSGAAEVSAWPFEEVEILGQTWTDYIERIWRLAETFLNRVEVAQGDGLVTPKAFVSYVREDSVVIDRLRVALAGHGIRTWTDREDLQPGDRWRSSIRDAIGNGSAFIACFSSHYAQRARTYMNEEITVAIDELRTRPRDRAWFFPVSLDGAGVPDLSLGAGESLRDLQVTDLSSEWTLRTERLATAIKQTGH